MDHKTAIYNYCNYQERSHKEVRNKLHELGCKTTEVNELIAELIEVGLLNEERYARAIARGKFRIKRWGRNKIISALKLQQISEYCIRKALTEIDEDEYIEVLKRLAEKRWAELSSERSKLIKKKKFYTFLLQRGFEQALINDCYKEIIAE